MFLSRDFNRLLNMQHDKQQFLPTYVTEMRTKRLQVGGEDHPLLRVRGQARSLGSSSIFPNILKQLSMSVLHKVVLMCYTILSVHECVKRSRTFGRALIATSQTLTRLQWPVSGTPPPPPLLLPSLHIPAFQSPRPKTDGFERHLE